MSKHPSFLNDPLHTAYRAGDENIVIEELRKISRQTSGRRTRANKVIPIIENTSSARIRNAAALALADMRFTGATDVLINLLKKHETKGARGTLLYALNQLEGQIPLDVLVETILTESYEAQEEALNLIRRTRAQYTQQELVEATEKLKTAAIGDGKAARAAKEALILVSDIEESRRTTPLGFFNFADSYARAAAVLHEHRLKTSHPDAPVYFLYYHAIELYLKAFLLMKEFSSRELRIHNPSILAAKSTGSGLDIKGEDIAVFALIADSEAVIRARYIKTGSYRWPAIDELARVCTNIRSSVGEALKENNIPVRL